jgi:hypothetical protein
MESGSHDTKWTSNQKDMQRASTPPRHMTETCLSEPDDSIPSDPESFDEEDMYSTGYNDEAVTSETVSDCLDSDGESQFALGGLVCASYYI